MQKPTTVLATALAALVLVPILLAGCSGAGVDEASPSPAAGKGRGTDFAACMREHGYDMEDPTSNGMTVTEPDGVDPEQYEKDLTACTGGGPGEGFAPATRVKGAEKKARVAAECVRAAGFGDYPDDLEEQYAYQPAGDEDAFVDVSKQCTDEAFGSSGGGTTSGGAGR